MAPEGAQLRCTRCKTVFRVEMPEAISRESAPAPARARFTPRARALIAERDRAIARRIADALERFQIEAEISHEGADALLRIFRTRPALAVLGAGLPGVSSPAIAELVRRTVELGRVRLIRVASAEEPVGPPEFDADQTLEAADLVSELGRVLVRLGLGASPVASGVAASRSEPVREPRRRPTPERERARPARPTPARPEPRPAPEPKLAARDRLVPSPGSPRPRPESARPAGRPAEPDRPASGPRSASPEPPRIERPRAEGPRPWRAKPAPEMPRAEQARPSPRVAEPPRSAAAAATESPEVESARRLARIAVSDIILYNEERFRQAAAAGGLPGALDRELDEARHLFRQRVPESLRAERDFLVEELMRRAEQLAS
jgi:hypothetical protein